MLKPAIVVALVSMAAAAAVGCGPRETVPKGRVLARLDEFTKGRTDPANSIPAFLRLPGQLGRETAPSVMEPLSETELLKGFCTRSLAQLIRHRYPDEYATLTDAELETRVLDRYPQYRDQVCHLPPWIDAAPGQIVKYEP